MTSEEVARIVGVSPARVRQAAPMFAEKHGRFWWWNEDGVKKLRERIGMRGYHVDKEDKKEELVYYGVNEFRDFSIVQKGDVYIFRFNSGLASSEFRTKSLEDIAYALCDIEGMYQVVREELEENGFAVDTLKYRLKNGIGTQIPEDYEFEDDEDEDEEDEEDEYFINSSETHED